MAVTLEQIKELREITGSSMMACKKAMEEADGDLNKAIDTLRKKGEAKAIERGERSTSQGTVASYIHGNGKLGVIVQIGCETDFVAKNDEFTKLGNEIAMQAAAMNPENIEELLDQDYIRDSSKKIKDLVTETISKTGENITIAEIIRFAI